MKNKYPNNIVDSTYYSLSLPVLLGGMRTRKTEHDAMLGKEGERCMVVELTSIVSLDIEVGKLKLSWKEVMRESTSDLHRKGNIHA